jgi:CDP-diacylglycerol--serine O-phosphatidyltransferase
LARFNVQIDEVDKRHFIGLPSPSAAGIMVGMIWVLNNLDVSGKAIQIPALMMTIGAGLLMVSNIKYNSFKDFDLKSKVPHLAILGVVLAFALVQVDPPKVLFAVFLVYSLSGPYYWFRERKAEKLLADNNEDKKEA